MTNLLWPVPGHYTISSGYHDWRPSYGLHGAIDIGAPVVPCVAIGAGRIIFVGWAGAAGLSVYLDMGTFRVHYCHLKSAAVYAGQVVQAGDLIGFVGASTRGVRAYPGYPNHLHLNLFTAQRPATGPSHWVGWVGMWCVDPELYLGKEDDVFTPEDKEWITNLLNGASHHLMFGKNMMLDRLNAIYEKEKGEADERHRQLIDAIRSIGR